MAALLRRHALFYLSFLLIPPSSQRELPGANASRVLRRIRCLQTRRDQDRPVAPQPAITVALLAFAFFASVASFGFHLNDEMELGVAAHNLYQGRLTVDDVPLAYYHTDGVPVEPRITQVGGHGYISESRATAVISAPAYAALAATDSLISASLLVTTLAVGSLALAIHRLLAARWRAHPDARMRERWLVWGAAAFVVLASALVARDGPGALWRPALAMQLGMMSIAATGVGILWSTVRRLSGSAWAASAAALILAAGSTISFWSFSQKYHTLQWVAVAAILHLRFARGSRISHAAAYAVAGIAVWAHVKTGGLLLAALVGADALALGLRAWRARRELRAVVRRHAPRAAAVAVGLGLGLAPYVVENTLLYGTPFVPGYVGVAVVEDRIAYEAAQDAGAGEEPGAAPLPPPPSGFARFVESVLILLRSSSILAQPDAAPSVMFETWVYPIENDAEVRLMYGTFMLAPLLALGLLGMWARRREARAWDAFIALHLVAILFVYGLYAAAPANGAYDSRYLVPLVPGLAIYAGMVVGPRLAAVGSPRFVAGATALALALLLGAALLLLGTSIRGYTAHVHFLRNAGIAVLALVLAWHLVAPTLARAAPKLASTLRLGDAPVLALGLFPPAWFVLQHQIVHAPRTIASDDGGTWTMMLPAVEMLREALRGWLL